MNISELNDWLLSEHQQPLIIGILNVTPDSFTDGGKFLDHNTAVNHAMDMIDNGADIIDIGGESTRPFSDPVSEEEELSRVISVIQKIREKTDIVISIDTTKSVVAEKACDAGANIINDISALSFDGYMIDIVNKYDCPIILMHMIGNPKTMQKSPSYSNIIPEITDHLLSRANFALSNGVKKHNIILDPGIGFGKTVDDNFTIINNMDKFTELGYPVLIGASRKSFIGKTLNVDENDRIEGTIVSNIIAFERGCKIFRVHDIKQAKRALIIANKILNSNALNT
ncbi:MAG: dihydropteroate synthase [Candidatus Marinimicrobia bacterium]|nr:dihydropteroate synthase [Candidatus Neomarinimicrobiota bacterium]